MSFGGFDVFGLLLEANPVVQLTLLLLAILSVASWTVIAVKWREVRRASKDSDAFLEVYHGEGFQAAFDAARHLEHSPLAAVFLAAASELRRRGPGAGDVRSIQKRLNWAAQTEAQRLERGLAVLSTTGSSAPFIGLFGTVVGIIGSFEAIGRAGSASLATVAPGIAEALIATGIGLFAAIPATIFYNLLVSRIDVITSNVDLFRDELETDLASSARSAAPPAAAMSGRGN